jgi:hypothetical protein
MTTNNQTQNNQTTSLILKLEVLSNQYDTVLLKYQQAITNYTSFLQNQSKNSSNKPSFDVLQGNAYWGTGVAGKQAIVPNISTPSSCSASCSKTSGCSGATFTSNGSNSSSCFLRTGDGPIVPSGSNDYAIIPPSKRYLLNIQTLNQQLTELNQQIVNIVDNQGQQVYSTEVSKRILTGKQLKNNYNKLIQERKMIEQKLREFQDLDEQQDNSELVTNSNYLSFILLLALAIICIVLLFKLSISGAGSNNSSYGAQNGGKLGNKAYYFLFAIIFLLLVTYYYKNLII